MVLPEKTLSAMEAILRAGPADFMTLCRIADIDPRVDFAHANLRNVDFRGGDLTGCDFTGADLENADFSRARLVDCRFVGANLRAARLLERALRENEFDGNADEDVQVVAPPGISDLGRLNPDLLLGEWVTFPREGRGRIHAIENRPIGNDEIKVLIIKLESGDPDLPLPLARADEMGLKRIAAPPDRLEDALAELGRPPLGPVDATVLEDVRSRLTSSDLLDMAVAVRMLSGPPARPILAGMVEKLLGVVLERLEQLVAHRAGLEQSVARGLIERRRRGGRDDAPTAGR